MKTQNQIDLMQEKTIGELSQRFQLIDVKSPIVKKYFELKQQGHAHTQALVNAFEGDLI